MGKDYRMKLRLAKPLGALAAGAGLLVIMPGPATATPGATKSVTVTRATDDPKKINISWAPVAGATRYNVSVFDGTGDEVSIVRAPSTSFTLTRGEPCVRLR